MNNKNNTPLFYTKLAEELEKDEQAFSSINPLDYQKSASPLIAELRLKVVNMLALNGPALVSADWKLVCDDRNKDKPLENQVMYFINEKEELIMKIRATNTNREYEHPSGMLERKHMHFSFAFQTFDNFGSKATVEELSAMSAEEWGKFKSFAYDLNEVQKFSIPLNAIEKNVDGVKDKELGNLLMASLNSMENFKDLQKYVSTNKLSGRDEKLINNYLNPGLWILPDPDIKQKRDFHMAQELKIILKSLEIKHTQEQFILTCNSSLMPYLRIERFGIEASRREEWSEYGVAIEYLFDRGSQCTEEKPLIFNDLDNNFYMFEHNNMPAISLTSQSSGYIFIKNGDTIEGYATGSDMLYSKEDILKDTSLDKLSLIIEDGKVLYWDSLLDPEQYSIFGAVFEVASINGDCEHQGHQAYKTVLHKYKKERSIIKEKKALDSSISNGALPGPLLKI